MKPLGLLRMGDIYIAFILFDLTMLSWGFVDKNIYDNIDDNKQVSNDFIPNNREDLLCGYGWNR